MPTTQPDPTEIALRQWTLGDYSRLARDLLPVATRLVDVADVTRGDRVLDVACGTGNVALTAWGRGAAVTGSDLVPRMLDLAEENAAIMGADDVAWRQADAADLPFDDGTFDATLSCFGHITALDPEGAGRELVRVTRSGGRIAYTSWTPDGLTRPILEILADYLPPEAPRDAPADFLWADPAVARERLGDDIEGLTVEPGEVAYQFLSPAHFWRHLGEYAGPFLAIRQQLDTTDREELDRAVAEALTPYFEENVVRLEYALVSATRR